MGDLLNSWRDGTLLYILACHTCFDRGDIERTRNLGKQREYNVSERIGAAFRLIYKKFKIEPSFSGADPWSWSENEEKRLKKYLLALRAKCGKTFDVTQPPPPSRD